MLRDLATRGAYRAVIDRRFAFEQIVEAHRYVDTGRKKGSVVVRVIQRRSPAPACITNRAF